LHLEDIQHRPHFQEQSGHHIDIAEQPSTTNGTASSAPSVFTAQIDATTQNAAEKIFAELCNLTMDAET